MHVIALFIKPGWGRHHVKPWIMLWIMFDARRFLCCHIPEWVLFLSLFHSISMILNSFSLNLQVSAFLAPLRSHLSILQDEVKPIWEVPKPLCICKTALWTSWSHEMNLTVVLKEVYIRCKQSQLLFFFPLRIFVLSTSILSVVVVVIKYRIIWSLFHLSNRSV